MVRDGICGESANGLKNGCRRWSVWVWVGQAGRSENCRRNFKLILCCFWSIISPHTKFRPNPMKNAVVENFHYWTGLVGQAGRSKNGRRHFKLILSCFCSIFSSHAKFHPNRTKNTEVRNFHFWSILVGRAGRSKNGHKHVVFAQLLAHMSSFIQIGWIIRKLKIFTFGRFWLVGLVGRKMVAATSNIQLPSGRL